MATIDLSKYGITGTTEIIHNPSYETLFEEETKPGLEGYDKGQVTDLGAVNVMTGIYTGRSPKDKFIVMDDTSKDTVWWTSDEFKNDNKPMSEATWAAVKELAVKELSGKDLPGGRSTFTVRFEVKNIAELEAIRTKLLNIRDVTGSKRGQN